MIDFREVAEAAARLRRIETSEDYGDIYPQDHDPTESDDRMLLSEAWLEDFADEISAHPVGPPTQDGLMGAIFDYLESVNGGDIDPSDDAAASRLGDAVQAAADLVLTEIRRVGGLTG